MFCYMKEALSDEERLREGGQIWGWSDGISEEAGVLKRLED